MNKTRNITFDGVNNTLPDTTVPIGAVSMGFGCTSRGYISTPLVPEGEQLYGIDGAKVLLIHEGSDFKNVFVYLNGYVYAYPYASLVDESAAKNSLCAISGEPTSSAVMGNIVVFTFADKELYVYRKNDEYVVRENKLPPIEMSIVAAVRKASIPDYSIFSPTEIGDNHPDDIYFYDENANPIDGVDMDKIVTKGYFYYNEDEENTSADALMGGINKMITFWAKNGYLMMPVLVRCCYRLKTGNVAALTNPVLCFPYETSPISLLSLARASSQTFLIRGIAYKLFGKFSSSVYDEDYADIIDSVEIYMSAPIYTHSTDPKGLRKEAVDTTISGYEGWENLFGTGHSGANYLITPEATDGLSYKELANIGSFYKVGSIPYTKEDLTPPASWLTGSEHEDYQDEIWYNDGNGTTFHGYRRLTDELFNATSEYIVAQTPMEDVLRSNITTYASKVKVYNSRLINIGSVYDYSQMNYISPIYFETCKIIANTYETSITSCPTITPVVSSVSAVIAVVENPNTGGRAVFLVNSPNHPNVHKYWTIDEPYVKYVALIGSITDGTAENLRLDFKTHDYMNVSIFTGTISSMDSDEFSQLYAQAMSGEYTKITRNDYIRESEVADPYAFEESNNAYFNSEVEDLLVIPEAISLGQYGSSQMYAVCKNGIYTVDINSEGELAAVNTYSQEVVDADLACVYKTRLAVNNGTSWDIYSGQQKESLLDLQRNLAFVFDNLPSIDNELVSGEYAALLAGNTLFDALRSAKLRYDGYHDTILAILEGTGYSAAWRPETGLHLIKMSATDTVQANGLVLADGTMLYDFSGSDYMAESNGLLITRAFHLNEDVDADSAIKRIVVEGKYNRVDTRIVVYGTRDYKNWFVIGTSANHYLTKVSGSGLVAFRLVVGCTTIERDDYISHISVEYEDKPRRRIGIH